MDVVTLSHAFPGRKIEGRLRITVSYYTLKKHRRLSCIWQSATLVQHEAMEDGETPVCPKIPGDISFNRNHPSSRQS